MFFCSVFFWTILYCSVFLWTILFCSVLFWSLLFCSVLFWLILFCSVLFCFILLCSVFFCSVLFWSIFFRSIFVCSLLNFNVHCFSFYRPCHASHVNIYCIRFSCSMLQSLFHFLYGLIFMHFLDGDCVTGRKAMCHSWNI